MTELGTRRWVEAYRRALDQSETLRDAAADWSPTVAFAFEAEGDEPTRYVRVELDEGVCRGVEIVDEDGFAAAPYRIAGPYSRWRELARGDTEPLRALLFRRLRFNGDLTPVLRHAPAVCALLNCLDTGAPLDAE